MAKHTNGPDLIDVESLMRAIEAMHGHKVTLSVSPAGIGFNGGLSVVLCCWVPNVESGLEVPGWQVVNRWPCPMHTDLWACVFEGLYRLDAAIGRSYEQQDMTK